MPLENLSKIQELTKKTKIIFVGHNILRSVHYPQRYIESASLIRGRSA